MGCDQITEVSAGPGPPYFYSHACLGRDNIVFPSFLFSCNISTHMPAGRDVSVSHLIPYRIDFYSHARKGRDKFAEISGNQFRDLYSHTHMGHDQYFLAVQTASVISTHRPARGVTGHDGNVFTDDGISTHTPARGVTILGKNPGISGRFLLTRPRGA